jgi:molecular chaperone GrpE
MTYIPVKPSRSVLSKTNRDCLWRILTKHGVKPITPAIGDTFDPQQHEAMFEAPVPGTRAGQIIQVMTEGFLLHDRLLRPAQVGVSSNTQG